MSIMAHYFTWSGYIRRDKVGGTLIRPRKNTKRRYDPTTRSDTAHVTDQTGPGALPRNLLGSGSEVVRSRDGATRGGDDDLVVMTWF